MQKNVRIRTAMAKAGINQGDLAKILNVSDTEVSAFMKYNLSKSEQDRIIEQIRARESGTDRA